MENEFLCIVQLTSTISMLSIATLRLCHIVCLKRVSVISFTMRSRTLLPCYHARSVLPLYKRNDSSLASNFRSITLVPLICKITEKNCTYPAHDLSGLPAPLHHRSAWFLRQLFYLFSALHGRNLTWHGLY